MSSYKKRPVAITMGCPAGIGPEIVVKALLGSDNASPPSPSMPSWGRVIIGDLEILRQTAENLGFQPDFRIWNPEEPVLSESRQSIYVLPVTSISPRELCLGRPSALTGEASYRYISTALDLAIDKKVAAIVTAPISKEGLKLAGINFPGHTEILADRCGCSSFAMMMAGKRLRVVLVTIHVPLSKVTGLLNKEAILDTLRLTWQSLLADFGLNAPRIGIAGLNPHAGEDGMFGREEQDIITPAVQRAREMGMDVTGPLPPDTIFFKAANGAFHAVVAMYHDQGLIPFKLLHFSDGVNVTIGLPIVRTSVDHGTAYDIAGKGIAHEQSMLSALEMAQLMVRNRAEYSKVAGLSPAGETRSGSL